SRLLAPKGYGLVCAGVVALVMVSYEPLRETIMLGQADVLVLLVTSAGIVCAEWGNRGQTPSSRYRLWAGVFLGLGTMLKLYPFGLVLYYAWKRQWRLAGAALATIGALIVLCLLVAGPRVLLEYWQI